MNQTELMTENKVLRNENQKLKGRLEELEPADGSVHNDGSNGALINQLEIEKSGLQKEITDLREKLEEAEATETALVKAIGEFEDMLAAKEEDKKPEPTTADDFNDLPVDVAKESEGPAPE